MNIQELYKDIEPKYNAYQEAYAKYSKTKEELENKEQELKELKEELQKELQEEQSFNDCEEELLKKTLWEAKREQIESQLKDGSQKYEKFEEDKKNFSEGIQELLNNIQKKFPNPKKDYCDVKTIQELCKNCMELEKINTWKRKEDEIKKDFNSIEEQAEEFKKSKEKLLKDIIWEDKKEEFQNSIGQYCDLNKIKKLCTNGISEIKNLQKNLEDEKKRKKGELDVKLNNVEAEAKVFKENKAKLFNSKKIENYLENIKKPDYEVSKIQEWHKNCKNIKELKKEQEEKIEEKIKKKLIRVVILFIVLFFSISLVFLKEIEFTSKFFWFFVIITIFVVEIYIGIIVKGMKLGKTLRKVIWGLLGILVLIVVLISFLCMSFRMIPERYIAEIILGFLISIIAGTILEIGIIVTKIGQIKESEMVRFYNTEDILKEIEENKEYYFILNNFEEVKNELLSKEQYKIREDEIKNITEFDFVLTHLKEIKKQLCTQEKDKIQKQGIEEFEDSYIVLTNFEKIKKQLLDKEENKINEIVYIEKLKEAKQEEQQKMSEICEKFTKKIMETPLEYQEVTGTLSNKIYIVDINNKPNFKLQMVELPINKKALLFLYQSNVNAEESEILNFFVPAFSMCFQFFNYKELFEMYIIDYAEAEKRSYNGLSGISQFTYKNEKVKEVYEKIKKFRKETATESPIDEYNSKLWNQNKQEFRKYMIIQFIFSSKEEYTEYWDEELWNTLKSAEQYGIIPIFYIAREVWEREENDKKFIKELRKKIDKRNSYVLEKYLK